MKNKVVVKVVGPDGKKDRMLVRRTNPLMKGFGVAIRPREKLKPWEWCEKHVVVDKTSSIAGGMKWRLDSSPWVREFMEVFADNRVETIVIRCATQSSKTQTLICLLCWVISEDPAPTLWVANAKDDLMQTVRDRMDPTFEACKPVADQVIGSGVMEYEFSTMTLYFVGGGSKGKVKSKPIRWLFMDEVEEIPAANVHQALERTKAQWNKRRVMLSTPNKRNGLMQQFFEKGDQRHLHIKCPKCCQFHQIKFEQWKFDKNETTRPDGKWNFDALADTIRWECPACGFSVKDTPYDRRKLAREAKFIAMNPNAPKHTVSFTWPSLIAPWVKWRDVVEKFLNARIAAKNGDIEPLKSFVNDDLGEPWDDTLGIIEDATFLEARKDRYDYGDVWPEAKRLFMAADRQEKGGEHYWYVIREFGLFGASRLVSHGRCATKEELESIRKENGVGPTSALIDTGYKAQDTYRFCIANNWKAFKGEDRDFYIVSKPHPKNPQLRLTVRQIWNKSVAVCYNEQTKQKIGSLPLYLFGNGPTNDLLAEYQTGLVGNWTIPEKCARDFLKQMVGDIRKEKENGKGQVFFYWHTVGDNHYRDCERMILTAAIITGCVNSPAEKVAKPKKDDGEKATVQPSLNGGDQNTG